MSKDNKMELQSAEFDAVNQLGVAYRRLTMTPVVDDDYPEMRHYYESALNNLITALRKNKRIT